MRTRGDSACPMVYTLRWRITVLELRLLRILYDKHFASDGPGNKHYLYAREDAPKIVEFGSDARHSEATCAAKVWCRQNFRLRPAHNAAL